MSGLEKLAPGEGSANEALKLKSAGLRGALAQELRSDSSGLTEESVQLLKFHGSYQQDDRDRRRELRATGGEKTYEFMVRSRIPGGALTAAQYLVHDDLARRYGNGTLRLTTRQSIQLHGVVKRDLRETISGINASLLSTLAACGDVNRNVMACPAPARDAAHAAVQESAHWIAMHLAPRTRAYHEIWIDGEKLEQAGGEEDEPIYGKTYLPRKFKIGIASPGDNCVDAFTQDLGFVAEAAGGELRGFTVVVGGGMGSTHGKRETYARLATPLCFALAHEAVEIAEAVVTIARDYGDRTNRKHARLKYVVEERGVDWVREELERRLGRKVAAPHPVRFDDAHDHLGWHRQADGALYLGLYVENGRVADRNGVDLRSAIRAVLECWAPDLRITGQQNLLLLGIPAQARAEIDAMFLAHGIETDPRALGLRRRAMACPALPTCGLAVAEAERALPEIVRAIECELAELGLAGERVEIRMTGCPNGCARPRMGDVGIVGRSLGSYDLYLGGDRASTRLNALFSAGVRQDAIARTLRPVLERWRAEREPHESLGDYVARIGVAALHVPVEVPA